MKNARNQSKCRRVERRFPFAGYLAIGFLGVGSIATATVVRNEIRNIDADHDGTTDDLKIDRVQFTVTAGTTVRFDTLCWESTGVDLNGDGELTGFDMYITLLSGSTMLTAVDDYATTGTLNQDGSVHHYDSALSYTFSTAGTYSLALGQLSYANTDAIEGYQANRPFSDYTETGKDHGDWQLTLNATSGSMSNIQLITLAGGGNWLNTTNTNNSWSTGSNWGSGVSPSVADDAVFTSGLAYNVAFTSSATAKTLNVARGDVTFVMGGQTLTASDLMVSRTTVGNLFLRIGDGTVGGQGTVNITGAGTQFIGYTGFNGTVSVNKATLNIPNASRLTVGDNAAGNLYITNGGQVNAGNNLVAADDDNATAIIDVAGAGSHLQVGGSMILSNDLNTNTTLSIFDGGTVTAVSNTEVANATTTSNATINVTGTNSNLTTTNLILGGTAGTNNGGHGVVNIQSGGSVIVSGQTKVWNNDSRINLNGGTLKTNSLDASGSFNGLSWLDGTLWLDGGTLFLQPGQSLSVPSLGTLKGIGSIGVNVSSNGIVSPGNSAGVLSISGNYQQSASGSLNIEIGGTAFGTEFDQLYVTGTPFLDGALNIDLINGFVPEYGDTFTIISSMGMPVMQFNGMPNGHIFTADGQQFQIAYGSGGVTLTALPEPTTLALIGLAAMAALRRRRT